MTKVYDFQFTERDARILAAVARYRFLNTGQIRRLVFAQNTSPQSARRRLRYLHQAKFLRRIQPPLTGNGKAETVWLLDRAGIAYVQNAGFELPRFGRFKQTSLPFLTHALALSEFRVHLELALANHPHARLHRFVADFELKTGKSSLRGQERYRLFETLQDPATGESHSFYPDALVILSGRGKFAAHKRLYFVEIDRGTENMTVIARKLRAYALAAQSGMLAKFGVPGRFRLLFQLPNPKRLNTIRKNFAAHPLATDIWLTTAPQVQAGAILEAPIWCDLSGAEHSILKPQAAERAQKN